MAKKSDIKTTNWKERNKPQSKVHYKHYSVLRSDDFLSGTLVMFQT